MVPGAAGTLHGALRLPASFSGAVPVTDTMPGEMPGAAPAAGTERQAARWVPPESWEPKSGGRQAQGERPQQGVQRPGRRLGGGSQGGLLGGGETRGAGCGEMAGKGSRQRERRAEALLRGAVMSPGARGAAEGPGRLPRWTGSGTGHRRGVVTTERRRAPSVMGTTGPRQGREGTYDPIGCSGCYGGAGRPAGRPVKSQRGGRAGMAVDGRCGDRGRREVLGSARASL